jgi:ABC-2 type transport system permease protein
MQRTWAIIERELRRFRRSPVLIVVSMIFPLVQLVVLGYAFGGNVKHLRVGIVDQDRGIPAIRLRELSGAVAANARTFEPVLYHDPGRALADLRNGRINGVLTIPPEFSRRTLAKDDPRIALIEDNTDNFVANALAGVFTGLVSAYNQPEPDSRRVSDQVTLDVVEVYPYVPYIQFSSPARS